MALADAPRERVLEAWAGLGYYSRARNLHAAAKLLAANGFPQTEAGWRELPGVGAYTAAAIAAIAFGEATNVVDGNVERVMARLFAVETPLPDAKPELRECAAQFITAETPGDWPQALMDLGATICTPKSPQCLLCPWRDDCAARATGAPESYPRRVAKTAKPQRFRRWRSDLNATARSSWCGGRTKACSAAWRHCRRRNGAPEKLSRAEALKLRRRKRDGASWARCATCSRILGWSWRYGAQATRR